MEIPVVNSGNAMYGYVAFSWESDIESIYITIVKLQLSGNSLSIFG